MKFKDIKKFPFSGHTVNISWDYLQTWLDHHNEDIMQLELDPPYQRGYVWSKQQKIEYIEYMLKGGFSGKDIFWNCPTWMSFSAKINVIELVDGKQRIQAVLDFLNNKISAFDTLYKDYEDNVFGHADFVFHINNLKSEREIVEWYIGFNTGGSVHTTKDLAPAYKLLKTLKEIK